MSDFDYTSEEYSTKLLCTFIERTQLIRVLDNIRGNFNISKGKIFLLSDKEDPFRYILTYNILLDDDNDDNYLNRVNNTIIIHRKKEYNALYTLDALNCINLEKYGNNNEHYPIDWENYQNVLLTTNKGEKLKKINTVLEAILEL